MYNGGGLGRKGAGVGRRSSAGFEESSKVFKDVSKASKRFRRMSGTSKEVSKASKGCPMTITPPSRLQQLDAMGAPGWGQICGGETNSVEADTVNNARGTRVRMIEGGNSMGVWR